MSSYYPNGMSGRDIDAMEGIAIEDMSEEEFAEYEAENNPDNEEYKARVAASKRYMEMFTPKLTQEERDAKEIVRKREIARVNKERYDRVMQGVK